MASGIRHAKVSNKQDSTDPTLVQASDWNAKHIMDVLSFGAMTDPTNPADGDFWISATGVSPARTISLKVRDAGITRILAFTTF